MELETASWDIRYRLMKAIFDAEVKSVNAKVLLLDLNDMGIAVCISLL